MIAGIMGRKEQLLEAIFGSMRSNKEVPTTSRRHHVATTPRRDDTKSRRRVNKLQKSIIQHVATSRRRDVSSKICISSLNARRLGFLGIGERTAGDTKIESRTTQPSKNFLDFSIVWIIFGSHDDVFHTIYFVSFFYDVLNSFLGLHQTLSQTMD